MKFENISLETSRLKMRHIDQVDSSVLFDIYSDPETMKYWSAPPFTDISQAQKKVEDTICFRQEGKSLGLAIVYKETDSLIGMLSLFNISQPSQRAEVGYVLSREYWNKGFMTEALSAFIEYCFGALDLRRLEADIDPENTASGALLKRLGFEREGLLRGRWLVDGKATDSEIYGLLRQSDPA